MRDIWNNKNIRIAPAAAAFLLLFFMLMGMPAEGASKEDAHPRATWTVVVTPQQKSRLEPARALEQVNQYRLEHGLGALRLSPDLIEAALAQSADMASRDVVSHHDRHGEAIAARLRERGYDPLLATENISGGQRDFEDAFQAWINSDVHRVNLLKPDLEEMGIAVTYDPHSHYGTFWVMILATPF